MSTTSSTVDGADREDLGRNEVLLEDGTVRELSAVDDEREWVHVDPATGECSRLFVVDVPTDAVTLSEQPDSDDVGDWIDIPKDHFRDQTVAGEYIPADVFDQPSSAQAQAFSHVQSSPQNA